jgi:hypothetical protein
VATIAEQNVDWFARALGGAGLLVALASFALQYVRHRKEEPDLVVDLEAEPDHPTLLISVRNKGKGSVGVTKVSLKTLDEGTIWYSGITHPHPPPLPGTVPGKDFVPWRLSIRSYRDGAPTAQFQVEVKTVDDEVFESNVVDVPVKPTSEDGRKDRYGAPVW